MENGAETRKTVSGESVVRDSNNPRQLESSEIKRSSMKLILYSDNLCIIIFFPDDTMRVKITNQHQTRVRQPRAKV